MERLTTRIVVRENSRSFSVVCQDRNSDSIHIDAAEFAHLPNRCDYAVRVSPACPEYFFFVELKGNDVIKAAKQLMCAIENLASLYGGYAKREAWVVSGGWRPAVSTAFQIQRAKARKYGFEMKHRTHAVEIDLAK